MNDKWSSDESPISNLQPPILKRIYRFLGRMDVAAVLILVVLLLAVLGSGFPQLSPSVAADPARLAQWEVVVRARYGGLADVLAAVGAFRCFRSPVFLVPLALLAAATLVCTLDRWRRLWRRAFRQPVRCSQAEFDGAPHTAKLSAAPAVDPATAVRECLEGRGFRVRATEVATTEHLSRTDATEVATTDRPLVYLRGDRSRLALLATLVTHLAVSLLLAGVALSGGYGWREEVMLGPGEAAEIGHGSGVAVRNAGFTVERYPDGSAAGYEAQIACITEGQSAASRRIRVNEPLTYGPVRLYLRGYGGTEGQHSITLLAVHDPGYGPVIVAGFLLLFGMAVSFNFPHCCVRARIEPDGTVCLAGRADRRAYDFGREFTELVEEVRRATGGDREGTG